MKTTNHLSIMLLYKGGCPVRLKSLHAVIEYYLWAAPGAELILIEQDTHTPVDKRVIHETFETDDKFFRRGLCFNLGYSVSTRDIILCVDSDILVEKHVLEDVGLLSENDLVVPYNKVRDISKTDLSRVHSDVTNAFEVPSYTRGYANEGGAAFLRRETYRDIGGFTAGFIGYGADELLYIIRCNQLPGFGVVIL